MEGRININTQVVEKSQGDFNLDAFLSTTTKKVANRLNINLNGLNTLATTAVTPNAVNNLDLEKTLEFSNSVNNLIGLPPTDSLIIRSSAKNPGNKASEKALLIKDMHGSVSFDFLDDGIKKPLSGYEEFTKTLKPDTSLLVHDDNYKLQTEGVHARLHESNFGSELLAGTKVLQSRELEMEGKIKPSIRVNLSDQDVLSHHKLKRLFRGNEEIVAGMLEAGIDDLEIDGKRIKLKNIDEKTAVDIIKTLEHSSEGMMEAHEFGQSVKGDFAVTEFRIYKPLPKVIGKGIQVLDID